jgi:hypothetical protein
LGREFFHEHCYAKHINVGHRLRVFEKRVLKRIFGHKTEEDGSWKKVHNNELHRLCSSPNIVRVMKSMRMK